MIQIPLRIQDWFHCLLQEHHTSLGIPKWKDAMILRFFTEEPDFSALPNQQFDWAYTAMAACKKLSHMTCPLLWESLSHSHTMWMQTFTMILSLEDLLLAFYTLPTRLPLIGTPRSRQLWKQLPMAQSLLLPTFM